MPVLASPSTWRQNPHAVKGYLVVWTPEVVFQALVNQTSFFYPIARITYDTVTVGAFTDVIVGQTVKVTRAGELVGYGRVRLDPTSSLIYIGVEGRGDLDLADNDTIQVLNEFRPWAKIPRIDVTNPRNSVFYKDYDLAYSDQGDEPPPKCNAGPADARFVDPDSGVTTVEFDLTGSFAVAEGATITDYDAELQDGSLVSGTINSGVFAVEFPAGKRICHFSADDSNGKTHTCHVPIFACERSGANAPIPVQVSSHHASWEAGWDASFNVLAADVDEDVIPKDSFIIYFEEEVYGEDAGSLNGYPDREHVKFVGWTTGDDVRVDPDVSDIAITCLGPFGRLNFMPSFSQSVENDSTPSAWNQMEALTVFKFIWYLLNWHTTILDLCDLELPSWFADYPFPRLDVDEGPPGEIADLMAQSVTARLTCDRSGRFYLRKNPLWMSDADRDDVDVTVDLGSTDWSELSFAERHQPTTSWLRGSGFLATTGPQTAYLSIAPGLLPGQGSQADSFERNLIASQADLNTRTGHVYAERQSQKPLPQLTIFRGGQVVDPAWREWIEFTLDADSSRRGISYVDTRFILLELTITHDHEQGTHLEEWSLQEETSGPAGTTDYLPAAQIDNISLTPFAPFELTIPDGLPLAQLPEPVGANLFDTPAFYAVRMQGGSPVSIVRCREFGSGSEQWELLLDKTEIPGTAENGAFSGFALDPWNPKNRMYFAAFKQVGSPYQGGVYSLDNLNGPVGSQVAKQLYNNNTDSGAGNIDKAGFPLGSIIGNGLVFWMNAQTFNGVVTVKKGGIASPFNRYDHGGSLESLVYDIGQHWASPLSGKAYFAQRQSVIQTTLLKSTNGGQTFSVFYQDPVLTNIPRVVHVPYENNPNDNIVYMGAGEHLFRVNEDLSVDDITDPAIAGYDIQALHSYTGERDRMALIAMSGGFGHLFISDDAGDTWTEVDPPASEFLQPILLGWPFDVDTMVVSVSGGPDAGIWYTTDLFSGSPTPTWTNAIGDFVSAIGSYEGIQYGTPVYAD